MGNHNWITTIDMQYRVDTETDVLDLQKLYNEKFTIKSFTCKHFVKFDKEGSIVDEYYIVDVKLSFNDKKNQLFGVTADIKVTEP